MNISSKTLALSCSFICAVFVIKFLFVMRYGCCHAPNEREIFLDVTKEQQQQNNFTETKKLDSKDCVPTKSIVYVKTHKTGSSTIKNVLGKYVKKNHLHQVRTFPSPFIGGYPGFFRWDFVFAPRRYNRSMPPPDTIMGHLRFRKEEFQPFMPTETKYITVMRSPPSQFQSAFHYYYRTFRSFQKKFDLLSCFGEPYLSVTQNRLRVNLSDYVFMAKERLNHSMPWYFRSKNFQAYDLGTDPKNDDENYVREYARELDDVFDLVLITDYFLESLILLKDTLCLEWNDLIAKPAMRRHYKKHQYKPEEIKALRALNKQDYILFEHFNATFWRKVKAYGRSRMAKDVKLLRRMLEEHNNEKTRKITSTDVREHKRHKRDDTNPINEPLIDVGRSIEKTISRIKKQCNPKGHCADSDTIREISQYMHEYSGWCP